MTGRPGRDVGTGSGGGPPTPPGIGAVNPFVAEIYMQVGAGEGATKVSCRMVDDETASALAAHGHDPAGFQVFTWPTGAARYAAVTVLMADQDWQALLQALGDDLAQPFRFVFGADGWEKMYALPPQTVLFYEAGQPVYAVEIVDARYHWGRLNFDGRGFNVTLDDKERFYDDTEQSTDVAHTFASALAVLLDSLLPWTDASDFFVDDPTGRLASSVGLRDLMVEGLSVSRTIDRVLTLCGYVLVAYPQPSGGFLYQTVPVEAGAARAKTIITASGNDFLRGGKLAITDTGGLDAVLAALLFDERSLNAQMPASVQVMFPTSFKGIYRFNQEDGLEPDVYTIGRWHKVVSATGPPAPFTGNGEVNRIFDCQWARFEPDDPGPPLLVNETELQQRANTIGSIYYGRFQSGAGPLWFRQILLLEPWSGAASITWRIRAYGPEATVETIVAGDMRDPLLGWRYDRAMSASGVLSIGDVRAMPRPEGGVLLDSPASTGGLVHPALIDTVVGGPNATYTAHAIDGSGVTFGPPAAAPISRDTLTIDYPAVAVGAKCEIIEYPGESTDKVLRVSEKVTPVTCVPPALPLVASPQILQAHGF